jgi:hypothetical protein
VLLGDDVGAQPPQHLSSRPFDHDHDDTLRRLATMVPSASSATLLTSGQCSRQ